VAGVDRDLGGISSTNGGIRGRRPVEPNDSLREPPALHVVACDHRRPLPASLTGLASLTHLDVRNNRLRTLPAFVGEVSRLVSLDLRSNALTTLPDSIGALPDLMRLDLRWNRILPRPAWLQTLADRGCIIWE